MDNDVGDVEPIQPGGILSHTEGVSASDIVRNPPGNPSAPRRDRCCYCHREFLTTKNRKISCSAGCRKSFDAAKRRGIENSRESCKKCLRTLSIVEFPVINGKHNFSYCRDCRRSYMQSWASRHPERMSVYNEALKYKWRQGAEERRLKRQAKDAARRAAFWDDIASRFGSVDAYEEHKKQLRLERYRERFRRYAARNPDKIQEKKEREKRLRRAEARARAQSKMAADGVRSLVYFIRSNPSGHIKIGYTDSGGMKPRLKSLQTGNPIPLEIVGVIRGALLQDEKDLHDRFSFCAIKNSTASEWFDPSPELLEYIKSHASAWTDEDEQRAEEAKRSGLSEAA